MPLKPDTVLNRDNCLPLLLLAFRSNEVVKALVFLPAVSDDFYLLSRNRPKLNLRAENLMSAITALTKATSVRATFRPPFLLLHLERESLEPVLRIVNRPHAERLKQEHHFSDVNWVDAHWERVQPWLENALSTEVLPAARSGQAWHFARHNLAGWDLSDWEVLSALSLTGHTTIAVKRSSLVFSLGQEMPPR